MPRPSHFEIMRRNRPKLANARESLEQKINRIEQETERRWASWAREQIALAQEIETFGHTTSSMEVQPRGIARFLRWIST